MVQCNGCKSILDEPVNTPMENRAPCSNCGSLLRLIAYDPLCVTSTVLPSIKAKARHGQPGEVKPFKQIKVADEIFRKTGERTFREKIEDRENNEYRERIVTHDGRLIKDFGERLTDHKGRGSAKRRSAKEEA